VNQNAAAAAIATNSNRSPASLELISLVDERPAMNGDATVELELSIETTNPEPAKRIAFRAPSVDVLDALAKHGQPLRALAASASCITGVTHLLLVIRVEGEEALTLRFPDRALRRIGPALETLVRGLGASSGALALAKW